MLTWCCPLAGAGDAAPSVAAATRRANNAGMCGATGPPKGRVLGRNVVEAAPFMDAPPRRKFGEVPALSLRGATEPWGWGLGLLLGAVFFAGLWARTHHLAAEGFADDEI